MGYAYSLYINMTFQTFQIESDTCTKCLPDISPHCEMIGFQHYMNDMYT